MAVKPLKDAWRLRYELPNGRALLRAERNGTTLDLAWGGMERSPDDQRCYDACRVWYRVNKGEHWYLTPYSNMLNAQQTENIWKLAEDDET